MSPAACNARRADAYGEMAERFKAPVLKTGEGSNLPWVRIPLSPPSHCDIEMAHVLARAERAVQRHRRRVRRIGLDVDHPGTALAGDGPQFSDECGRDAA